MKRAGAWCILPWCRRGVVWHHFMKHSPAEEKLGIDIRDRQVRPMSLVFLMTNFEDGDQHGWKTEFDFLRSDLGHKARLDDLKESIAEVGVIEPIILGLDGRVWDGHHRICAAFDLGIEHVPVKFSEEAR